MELNVHIDLHPPEPRFGDPVVQRLDPMLALLQRISKGVLHMSLLLENLIEKVTAIETVSDSAVTLLSELKGKLDDAIASGDPAMLQELSDRLGAQTEELAAAISANTPSEE